MSLNFHPGPGERVETTLTLEEPETASFFARLRLPDGSPAPGVLALLFDAQSDQLLEEAVSDEGGRICFGPLAAGRLYTVRLHLAHPAGRVLEAPCV